MKHKVISFIVFQYTCFHNKETNKCDKNKCECCKENCDLWNKLTDSKNCIECLT